jgi:hypothetical protein
LTDNLVRKDFRREYLGFSLLVIDSDRNGKDKILELGEGILICDPSKMGILLNP